MESRLVKNDLLTGHEPGIPGGETPPSTAGGTPAATEGRFMERSVFQIWTRFGTMNRGARI
jgi:hypothetical protein